MFQLHLPRWPYQFGSTGLIPIGALRVHGSSMLKPCRNMIQPSKSSSSSNLHQNYCIIAASKPSLIKLNYWYITGIYWYNFSPGHWRCPALQVSRHLPAADSSCLQSSCDERALRPRRLSPKWLRGFPRSDQESVAVQSNSDRGVPRSNSEVGRWCHCNLRSNRQVRNGEKPYAERECCM